MLDDATLDMPCPDCGHKIKERIGRLRANKTFVCAGCGNLVKVETDALDAIAKSLKKSVEDLKRTFRKLGK